MRRAGLCELPGPCTCSRLAGLSILTLCLLIISISYAVITDLTFSISGLTFLSLPFSFLMNGS